MTAFQSLTYIVPAQHSHDLATAIQLYFEALVEVL